MIKGILSGNRGAVAVLLMCILGSFIFITGVLVAASVSASGKSYADATFQLAGKAILSEYDRKLMDEYGLLCFRGDEKDISGKLKYYSDGSFKKGFFDRKSVDLLKLDLKNADVTLKEYSMVNVDLYEEQIKEALKTKLLETSDKKDNATVGEKSNRVLRNEIVIESLPSAGFQGSIFPDLTDAANIPAWEEVTGVVAGTFARGEYAFKVFKHANGGNLDNETFFDNEIEYLIEGKLSDRGNYQSVKLKLLAMRYALNAIYLISDQAKMAMITAQASATGPATPAVEAAIFASWVGAETDNDIDLLENGKKVALIKTPANWALNDLAKVVEGISASDDAVVPVDSSGLSYRDYLRIFLYLQDRETMLLRMMDLMQINMKGTYYRDFLLKEHFAGFRFTTTVKGDTFNYVEQY